MPRLIDANRIVYSWTIDNDGEEHDGVTLQSIIDKMPTVDAEPVRHGHWIKANDPMSSPFDTMKRCLCSECREWAAVTSYCPNCGAKMDEEEK